MAGARFDVLLPLLFYFVAVYILGFYSMKYVSQASRREGKGFLTEYLVGDRKMGGFVLAMTLVATYLSAGSFIGGPGTAYSMGLSWVFLAMAQMPTGYFTLAVLGKKFAIVARKINAVTVSDFLKERYENKTLVLLVSVSVVFFFIAAMTAQFVGAARLLQGAVNVPYQVALTMFALTVIIYTIVGGFRAVVLTDTLQGVVMSISTLVLIIAAIAAGGGVKNIVDSLSALDPGLISPYGPDPTFTSMAWVTSFWILVGFAVVGLPQVATRAMGYKDCRSLNRAIIYGTAVSNFLLLAMHLLGAFGRVLVADISTGDLVVPAVVTKLFPNWLAGVVLAGPLAAVMSTVDSQLLVAAGAIINDIYANLFDLSGKKTARITFISSVAIGVITFAAAFNPPELMVWLNLYANAGLISTFLWPVILGLYWKRANTAGAFASIITGIGSYIFFNTYLPRPLGMHTIVVPLLISLAAFVIVAYLTPKPPARVIKKFWGI
jgi:sodium/pantothenate symporter